MLLNRKKEKLVIDPLNQMTSFQNLSVETFWVSAFALRGINSCVALFNLSAAFNKSCNAVRYYSLKCIQHFFQKSVGIYIMQSKPYHNQLFRRNDIYTLAAISVGVKHIARDIRELSFTRITFQRPFSQNW